MVTHCGIRCFPHVLDALGKHLTYQWIIETHWNGDANKQYLQQQVVLSKWLPILVFSKGTPHLQGGFCDTIHFDAQEKQWHDWQQPVDVFEKLIEAFSQPGDLIVDPCSGAFTTAVACQHAKRRCIACDVDEKCVKIGAARLHNERSGKYRNLPVGVLPTDGDRILACTDRSLPRSRKCCRPGQFVIVPPIQHL